LAAGLSGPGALPVATEIDRRPASHCQPDDAIHLLAVTDAAEVLAPGRLSGVTDEIGSGDVVVMSEFAAAQAGEIGFRGIGAGTVDAEAVLVVDPLHGEAGVQRVPRRALIGMNRGALGDPLADRGHRIRLGRENLRQRAAAALVQTVSIDEMTGIQGAGTGSAEPADEAWTR
jgi:hypothetical protein